MVKRDRNKDTKDKSTELLPEKTWILELITRTVLVALNVLYDPFCKRNPTFFLTKKLIFLVNLFTG